MTKKDVASFRLSTEIMEQLEYLQSIAHQSQASIIEDLINGVYRAVRQEAFFSPGSTVDPMDPTLVKNGGTFISIEEQRALATVRDRLVGEDGGRTI